jgi:hypothetical protein
MIAAAAMEIPAEPMPDSVLRLLAGRVIGGVKIRDCRVTGPLGVSQVSRLFRAVAGGLTAPLAIKFCLTRDGLPDVDLARRQYAALKWLGTQVQSGQASARMVRVLDLIEDRACLVMEWAEGRAVAAVLASPMTSEAETGFWSEESGKWLRSFHGLRQMAPRPTDTKTLIGLIDKDLPKAKGLAANPSFAHGDRVLRQAAARVASIAVPCAIHHGDFKAENLMISSGTLVGLDISNDWNDVVTLDIAKFIRDVGFRSWRPSGWMLGWRYDDIVHHFLAGYAQGEALDLALPLSWARLHGLLRFWIDMENIPPDPIRESYGRYRFEQIVTQVAEDLSRQAASG